MNSVGGNLQTQEAKSRQEYSVIIKYLSKHHLAFVWQ